MEEQIRGVLFIPCMLRVGCVWTVCGLRGLRVGCVGCVWAAWAACELRLVCAACVLSAEAACE